jgi:uncharacterized protein with NRDE domain
VTIILKNYLKDIPLIIGNNRDELSSRNFTPPCVISESPYIVGGIDLLKGGTWLGINENNIVINILNKFKNGKNFFGSDKYRSRGILVSNLLKLDSMESVLKYLTNIPPHEYLPFFLIIADKEKVFFVEYDEGINCREIFESLFIVGNLNPFETDWEKYKTGYLHFQNLKGKETNKVFNELKSLLRIHRGNKNIPSEDYAVNLGDFCTTSSSIIILKDNGKKYYFANGSPLNTDYQDYTYLLEKNQTNSKEEKNA